MNRLRHLCAFNFVMLGLVQTHAQDLLRISRIVLAQQVDSCPAAAHPEDAKTAGIEGTVTLDVVVSATGNVEQVRALSGPYKSREAAKQSVSKWSYKLYKIDDVAREVDTTVLVQFSLKDGGTSRNASGDAVETMAEASVAPSSRASLRANRQPWRDRSESLPVSWQAINSQAALPVYPADAKAEGITGSVVMRAFISRSGMIDSIKVLSGPSQLRQAAIDSVKTWIYKPFQRSGEPSEVLTQIMVNFNLTGRQNYIAMQIISGHSRRESAFSEFDSKNKMLDTES